MSTNLQERAQQYVDEQLAIMDGTTEAGIKRIGQAAYIEMIAAVEAVTTKAQSPRGTRGEKNKEYLADLRHDLQDEEYRLQYLSACAMDSAESLRVGIRDVLAQVEAQARLEEAEWWAKGACDADCMYGAPGRCTHLSRLIELRQQAGAEGAGK